MERANKRSLEAVRETVQPRNEETIGGDHAESGCEFFYSGAFHCVSQDWILPVCILLVMLQHWFLTNKVKRALLLQHLTIADVKHLKSRKQNLHKMRLVVEDITRLGVVAGVNTNPKTIQEVMTLYEVTKGFIITDRTEKNRLQHNSQV
eukprot:1954331-Ditylum_brightwellii.AAC.1